jgi:hypothetical protein
VFVIFWAFGLVNSLSHWWLYLLLKTPFLIFEPHIVRRTFCSNTSYWFWFSSLLVNTYASLLCTRSLLHNPRQTTLYLLVFSCSRWCLSLLFGLFLPVFLEFRLELVVVESVNCETSQLLRLYVAGTAYSCSQFYND